MGGGESLGLDRLVVPRLELDELLSQLQARLDAVLATRDRVHRLLEAVLAVGSDLDLEHVLRRIVEAAVELVEARYGALGVLGEGDQPDQFVAVGGDEPNPLRLADLPWHPDSAGLPRGHPPMGTFLGVPVRVRREVFGNLYLGEKRNGGQFDEEDEAVLAALAAAAGVTIENARLYEEARRRERWLEASAQVTHSLLSGTDSQRVLALVADRARAMASADLVLVALPEEGGRRLVVQAASGTEAATTLGHTVPGEGAVPVVPCDGSATVVAGPGRAPVACPRANLPAIGPALLVPLGAPGRVRGVLMVANRGGVLPFSPPTVRMLAAFAGQAAVALELAEHRRQAARLSVYEERDRIARDLHDLVIQRLFATGMALEGTSRLIESPKAAARVTRAVDDLDRTIKEIRSTIFALQDRDEPGSRRALRVRVLQTMEETVVAPGFAPLLRGQDPGAPRVPGEVGEHGSAAPSDTARIAEATYVDVEIEAGRRLTLRVRDYGCGVRPGGHLGDLAELGAWARLLHGTFRIEPHLHGGTVLEWQVRLDHRDGARR